MSIQIITGRDNLSKDSDITISNYSKPLAMDDFDINIVDLSYNGLWVYDGNDKGRLNSGNDFSAIKHMSNYSTKSIIIYVYPQNGTYKYDYLSGKYYKSIKIRDVLNDTTVSSKLGYYLFDNVGRANLICEHTNTLLGKQSYGADFHFNAIDDNKVMTKSNNSEKITTIIYDRNIYITTLDICSSNENVVNFVNNLFSKKNDEEIPKWIKEYNFGNDKEAREIIENSSEEINKLKNVIDEAKKQLELNNKYKSILFTSGEKLVEVIFEILQKILECDLSNFVDKKNEDFLINKDEEIFIGEIKGVSTNVKSPHISQLDVHYQTYIDDIQDDQQISNIHPILIINPLRTIEVNNREPIHEKQIKLANDRGSLIIETVTLLKIFELYEENKLTTEHIIEVLSNKKGLLRMEDFDE